MKIRYSVTIDDYAEWVKIHYSESPALRKQIRMATWTWTAILGIPGVIWLVSQLVIEEKIEPFAIVLILVAIYTFFTFRRQYTKTSTKLAKKMAEEGSTRGLIGDQEMELHNDGLLARSFYGENKSYWRGIERVVTTDKYVFVYLSRLMAYIIPIHSIREGDLEAFVAELKRELAKVPPYGPPPTSVGLH